MIIRFSFSNVSVQGRDPFIKCNFLICPFFSIIIRVTDALQIGRTSVYNIAILDEELLNVLNCSLFSCLSFSLSLSRKLISIRIASKGSSSLLFPRAKFIRAIEGALLWSRSMVARTSSQTTPFLRIHYSMTIPSFPAPGERTSVITNANCRYCYSARTVPLSSGSSCT